MEAALQGGTAVGADSKIRVAYDTSTDEFVIIDILGRELEIQGFTGPESAASGAYFKSSATVAQSNKYNPVQISTDSTSGVLTEATKVNLVFSQDDASGVVFSINGRSNSSSAIDFNFATDTFAGSDFKTILNNMMNELNHHYNGSPLSYELNQDTRTLTITHAKGGELFIDDFVSTSENLVMNLEVVSGDGEDTVISYDEVLTSASAQGSGQDYTTISANAEVVLVDLVIHLRILLKFHSNTRWGQLSLQVSITHSCLFSQSELNLVHSKIGLIILLTTYQTL